MNSLLPPIKRFDHPAKQLLVNFLTESFQKRQKRLFSCYPEQAGKGHQRCRMLDAPKGYLWMDGEFASLDDAGLLSNALALNQSFQFGDLLFEGIRYGPSGILLHAEHRNRMYAAAGAIGLPLPSQDRYDVAVQEAIAKSKFASAYIRIFALRGFTGWGIDSNRVGADPELAKFLVVIGEMALNLHGSGSEDKGLRVMVARTRKPSHATVDATIKRGGNYLINKRALDEARQAHCHDAIVLTEESLISEATVENVFWVRRGHLFTPHADARTNCLPGITRRTVIDIAKQSNIEVHEDYFFESDLGNADEIFLTGTGAGILPVGHFQGRQLPVPGQMTRTLQRAYHEAGPGLSIPLSNLTSGQ